MKILTDDENKIIGYASDGDGTEYDGEIPEDFGYDYGAYILAEGRLKRILGA